MLVGLCQIELFIPESGSLKSKRFVLSSIKQRVHNKFNVSIAEIDGNDKWQKSTLGIALVANERQYIDKVMSQILNMIEQNDQVQVIDRLMEII
ncbi:DUF503 domain-containing protein [candidate division KSB1 bacterium]|nr:DUF503 domain-containing protein [candidate division KSB1 bacterium]